VDYIDSIKKFSKLMCERDTYFGEHTPRTKEEALKIMKDTVKDFNITVKNKLDVFLKLVSVSSDAGYELRFGKEIKDLNKNEMGIVEGKSKDGGYWTIYQSQHGNVFLLSRGIGDRETSDFWGLDSIDLGKALKNGLVKGLLNEIHKDQ